MNKKRICLFGGGPHGQVVSDIASLMNEFELVGFIDSKADIGSEIAGVPVIGRQENLVQLTEQYSIESGVVCIGDNFKRKMIVDFILNTLPSFSFENIIHPSVVISSRAKIGCGNVFMPGVVINTSAEVKDHCIINTNSSLEHYCLMEDYSSISAGVTTGGFVDIGKYSAIALGATLFDRISIGENTVVGSHSLVTRSFGDNLLIYGNPAKEIRSREPGETFLK